MREGFAVRLILLVRAEPPRAFTIDIVLLALSECMQILCRI